jgi:hypothetical protein
MEHTLSFLILWSILSDAAFTACGGVGAKTAGSMVSEFCEEVSDFFSPARIREVF